GFHLDLSSQTLEFWIGSDTIDIVNEIKPFWSGWNIIFYLDHFEFQEEKTQGKLRFSQPDYQIFKKSLEDILLREENKSPVDGLLEISEQDRQAGKKIEINSWALRDDNLELNIDRRKEILDKAFNQLANDRLFE
ncbi:MAG: hypothetical protein ACRDBG_04020, partial [Waterburya sp.]